MALAGPPAFSQEVTTLEEIVVTARKREENLQEVPVSISVISDSLIDEAGIIEPRDFFELTPGVDFDTNGDRNNATPAVRGIQGPRHGHHPAEGHVIHRWHAPGRRPGHHAVHRA